ncbi:MAG: ImmA/IrrE family metallo-endopeptidase [Caldilineaceae bacterium]|nr:ImmA/IrrE family metallo-endopeptidase [Caldilineaceae bacterium]
MSIQEAIADLYAETGVARPTVRRAIVRLNDLIRALNLTCHEVAGLTRDVASRMLAERGSLQDEDGGERQSPLAGFLYAVGDDGSIFVEERDPVVRRRFSVAHELGHYLLHFRPLLTQLSAAVGAPVEALDAFPKMEMESDPDSQPDGQIVLPLAYVETHPSIMQLPPLAQMEVEANRFAAELLMPAPLVLELARHYGAYFGDDNLVWRLANEMLVSRPAMRWRLRTIGWTGGHSHLNGRR